MKNLLIWLGFTTCLLDNVSGFSREGFSGCKTFRPKTFALRERKREGFDCEVLLNRERFFYQCIFSMCAVLAVPNKSDAISYSSNARNMERLASGDGSGGSVYDNNPKTEVARKRRAMTGCKFPSAREEAAQKVLKVTGLFTEKDCNLRVLEGDTEFMLQALRNLDCSTCPYGIKSVR